jgi:hypothetical protein
VRYRKRHGGAVFAVLSKEDRAKLDAQLAQLVPTPGLEGLVRTRTPATRHTVAEEPTRNMRGRRE